MSLVPLTRLTNRTAQLQALEQMLEDLHQEGMAYLLQFKPETNAEVPPPAARRAEAAYLPDGTLNLALLEKNAQILLSAGEFGPAKTIYEVMLRSSQAPSSVRLGMGRALLGLGDWIKAQEAFEEAIAYEPTAPAYIGLLTVLGNLGRHAYAAEVAERAMGLDEARFVLSAADAWRKAERPDRAEALYRQGLSKGIESLEALEGLAEVLVKQGKAEEARAVWERTVALEPQHAEALYALAMAHQARGDENLALSLIVRSLEARVQHVPALFQLIKLSYSLKIFEPAHAILQKYVASAPVNSSVLYCLAGVQSQLGLRADASRTLRQILQLEPQHARAKEMLARIDYSQGEEPHGSGTDAYPPAT